MEKQLEALRKRLDDARNALETGSTIDALQDHWRAPGALGLAVDLHQVLESVVRLREWVKDHDDR